MPHSKANHFEAKVFTQATWSKVQAHPARIKILTYIHQYRKAPFFELNRIVPELSGPAVSQHILYLIRHKVLLIHEKYPRAIYAINYELSHKLALLLSELQDDYMLQRA